MMSTQHPSNSEEEYFARKEYERLRKLAAEKDAVQAADKAKKRQELHYMHCPKCGGDLTAIVFKQIEVDKCTSCAGVWLDNGELEQILQQEDAKLLRRILKVFHNG
ncbi:MAG: zf-TFIIB domain-containing protein [Myxococcota bacterium]|jgi:hypothetical protein|nr:zf-TFIIB domain-containing protein [Myxococcota bacterium]